MNQKSFVIAAILAATALTVIATPSAYAQVVGTPTGDISATVTGQTSNKRIAEVVNQTTPTVART
jgi:hypothetical protein